MTTQAELLKSLRNRKASASSDDAKPEAIGFKNQGDKIQGIVKEVQAGTVWDRITKAPKKDKNGNEIPQLVLTLELEDGTLRRQFFANDLLWKLSDALEELGLEEVPIGAIVGSAWIGMWNNTLAREHVVKIKVA